MRGIIKKVYSLSTKLENEFAPGTQSTTQCLTKSCECVKHGIQSASSFFFAKYSACKPPHFPFLLLAFSYDSFVLDNFLCSCPFSKTTHFCASVPLHVKKLNKLFDWTIFKYIPKYKLDYLYLKYLVSNQQSEKNTSF